MQVSMSYAFVAGTALHYGTYGTWVMRQATSEERVGMQ